MKYLKLVILLSMLTLITNISAQDNLDSLLNSQVPVEINYITATFKATRIINGQSIERMPQGQLDTRFHHRFGPLNQGAYNFWGLDGANTFLSLEYGITNWVMAGVGRTNIDKTFDGFAKFSLYRQSTGKRNMPVSISWYSSASLRSQDFLAISSNPNQKNSNYPFSTRLSYVHQLLIARKFNQFFSLQLSPSVVHYNLVPTELDLHDVYAIGIGGRIKLVSRVSFNAEYFYVNRPANSNTQNFKNPFSIGFDIETGGHVFQLLVTNAGGMIEKQFIGETTDMWNKAGIHFGFNISRVFDINHHK